jgi:transposase, IS5 family
VLRTVNDQPTLWDAILPSELLVLPTELARVDALLDDPVFFAPFAAFFDARIGRPSIPVETYLRLMFLKFRYRLGYESLCREVADSISWQRFCRIPLGMRVPHPTTLMTISSRCGHAAVAALNEALLVKAAAGKLLRTDRVRADTTVVEADVGYPTDSGLLAKGIGAMCRSVARIKTLGGATDTRARDRRRSAGRRARSIASKLRLRAQQQRDQAQAAVRRITGELADIAQAAVRDADMVIRNARRALRTASGARKARLQQAINHLATVVGRTQQVLAQTRSRLAGVMPESAGRLVGLHHVDARPIRKGRLGKPVEFGYKAQVVDNADGVILDHTSELGNPADAPQLVPAIERITRRTGLPPRAVTADRATATPQSNATFMPSVCAVWSSRAAASPGPPVASSNTGEPSAIRSNGEPDQKDGSTTSSEATAGIAPNSPASRVPEPGADTASSPTTWSRSAPWPHENRTTPKPAPTKTQARTPLPDRRTLLQVLVTSYAM